MGRLAKLQIIIGANTAALKRDLKGAETSVGKFKKTVSGLGGMLGAAFVVAGLVAFGKEAVKVAAAGEGIRIAFGRLNKPGLLAELRKATQGTVTDIELMASAVEFDNFKLPLENLGMMLRFVEQRARTTGASVDYLTNSLVEGLSKNSLLRIDNLGISATVLRDRMKDTGDMASALAQIMEEDLGFAIMTTATKMDQQSVKLQNTTEWLGSRMINIGKGL